MTSGTALPAVILTTTLVVGLFVPSLVPAWVTSTVTALMTTSSLDWKQVLGTTYWTIPTSLDALNISGSLMAAVMSMMPLMMVRGPSAWVSVSTSDRTRNTVPATATQGPEQSLFS